MWVGFVLIQQNAYPKRFDFKANRKNIHALKSTTIHL